MPNPPGRNNKTTLRYHHSSLKIIICKYCFLLKVAYNSGNKMLAEFKPTFKMKIIITTFLLFVYSFTFGQPYKSIVAEADAFYNNKEFKKSVEKYKEAFKLEQKSDNDFYNAGCSASLLGDKKLAFKWLNIALKNGWSNVRNLKTDTDLTLLHSDKKWNKLVSEMQSVLDKREANMTNRFKQNY